MNQLRANATPLNVSVTSLVLRALASAHPEAAVHVDAVHVSLVYARNAFYLKAVLGKNVDIWGPEGGSAPDHLATRHDLPLQAFRELCGLLGVQPVHVVHEDHLAVFPGTQSLHEGACHDGEVLDQARLEFLKVVALQVRGAVVGSETAHQAVVVKVVGGSHVGVLSSSVQGGANILCDPPVVVQNELILLGRHTSTVPQHQAVEHENLNKHVHDLIKEGGRVLEKTDHPEAVPHLLLLLQAWSVAEALDRAGEAEDPERPLDHPADVPHATLVV
mmetsp:Transcript_21887/g.60758  ORF Transcript_21887/g.60758 Transcript_21887/m.60758 type:complete len:275 (+) Transcript_21887:234-1058(+)